MNDETFKCIECGMTADVPQTQFNYCPGCGTLGTHWQALCNALLTLYEKERRMAESLRLYRKAAYPDAARSALISIETELKRLGETKSYGTGLVDEVLSFEYDNKTKKFVREPIVKVNDLNSQNDRNEQDGIRLLISGMFKGLRNALMHNHVKLSPVNALSVVVMSNLVIDILNKGSILKERVCIVKKIKWPNKPTT